MIKDTKFMCLDFDLQIAKEGLWYSLMYTLIWKCSMPVWIVQEDTLSESDCGLLLVELHSESDDVVHTLNVIKISIAALLKNFFFPY